MGEIQVGFPFDGLDENLAFSKQSPTTTRAAINMRGIDPVTGRIRGAQRSGLSQYAPLAMGGNRVSRLDTLTLQDPLTTYTPANPTSDWNVDSPSESDVRDIALDRQSNVFVTDGLAGFAKLNSKGELQYKISVDVSDDAHEIRHIIVDDFNSIYVAVGAGGRESGAKIVKYRELLDEDEDDDTELCKRPTTPRAEKLWEIVTDAYVAGMQVREGKLYTLQNLPMRNASEVVIYESIDSLNPEVAIRRGFPYPATGISVRANGDFYGCADANPSRGEDPRAPNFTAKSQDWTPENFENHDDTIWSWYDSADPDSILTSRGLGNAEEGDEITAWLDRSGNQRHFVQDGTNPGPLYRDVGIGGRPCLRFEGNATTPNILQSAASTGIERARRDQQKTALPAYAGADATTSSTFLMCMVLRPRRNKDAGAVAAADDVMVPFYQESQGTGSGLDVRVVCNRAAGGFNTVDNPSFGDLIWLERNTASSASPGVNGSGPAEGSFDNNVGTVILTVIMGDVEQGGAVKSIFRVNGITTDEYDSDILHAHEEQRTILGAEVAGTEFAGEIAEIIVYDLNSGGTGTLIDPNFSLRPTGTGSGSVSGFQSETIVERLEGYLGHKWGCAHLLQEPDQDQNAHPWYLDSGAPLKEGFGPWNRSPESRLNSRYGVLAKFSADKANPLWVVTSEALWVGHDGGDGIGTPQYNTYDFGGIGFACSVACNGDVYSLGPNSTYSNPGVPGDFTALVTQPQVDIRRVVDQADVGSGERYSINPVDGAWTYELALGDEFTEPGIHMDVDAFDNLWVPCVTAVVDVSLLAFAGDGGGTPFIESTIASGQKFYVARTNLNDVPDYPTNNNVKRPEFVYLGGSYSETTPALYRLRVVGASPSTGPVRQIVNLAVVAGDIVEATTAGPINITGGVAALSAGAQYVDSTTLYGDVFFADGIGYAVYRSKENDIVEYTSKKGGELPKRAKLITNWRGRIVLARTADDPHSWKMSKAGDPYDWDEFPPVITADQAIAADRGNQSAGRVPDVVNALVSYNDDLMLFGGDRSIWRLTGDPMAGGQMDLVSDVTGMAFGRSWTKDPSGIVYFFGSRGGVFRMQPGGLPQRLSVTRIERTLQSLDLSKYYVELFWNYRDEGLHVFQFPYSAQSAPPKNWFWEQKTNSWWEDRIGPSTGYPAAAMVLDGDDPGDRVILIGGTDGFVRVWDENALDDDTERITSSVLIGPVHSGDVFRNVRWSRIVANLASDQGGARYRLFSSDVPDRQGAVYREGALSAGRNDHLPSRIKDPYLWVELYNAAPQSRWAFESMSMFMNRAGRLRRRARR